MSSTISIQEDPNLLKTYKQFLNAQVTTHSLQPDRLPRSFLSLTTHSATQHASSYTRQF